MTPVESPGPVEVSHDDVRVVVGRLRTAVTSLRGGDQLRVLAKLLPRHFAWEERRGGVLSEIAHYDAEVRGNVRGLFGEHRAMLDELPLLMALCEMAGDEPTQQRCLDRCRAFCRDLEDHEWRETLLVAEQLSGTRWRW